MTDRTKLPGKDVPASAGEALEVAFEALKSYDWGTDPAVLGPIDIEVFASQPGMRKELETRLGSALKTNAPRAAKDFACRKLALIGTAQSVPVLATLLPDKALSHMARYALERIGSAEADKALRDALPKLEGNTKIGAVNSLAARRDARSASQLAALLNSEPEIAASAAFALGQIGSPEAARSLKEYRAKAPVKLHAVVADACLACAQRLLAYGHRDEAISILRSLSSQDQPNHLRQAAKHALSAANRMGKL